MKRAHGYITPTLPARAYKREPLVKPRWVQPKTIIKLQPTISSFNIKAVIQSQAWTTAVQLKSAA